MPANDERREVAARIRELRKHVWDESSVFDLLGCAVEERGIDDTDQLFARLADLIEPEERTCRLTYDTVHDDMVCSSCGAWLDMVAYSELETSGQIRYCPACGARVVDDHA